MIEAPVRVRLTDNIAPAFHKVHNAIKNQTHSSFWLKGGRGSTKSSFVAIEIILGMMKDPNANAIVFRKVGDTIRDSVLTTLEWAIEKLEVGHLFRSTVSPASIVYKPTGQKIVFKGLDSPLKLKSIRLKRGYFKYSWYEETAEFGGPEELRSVGQSVKRGGESFVEFFSYNPPIDPQAWVNAEAEIIKPGKYLHESTYLDVPPDWLGEEFINEAQWLKENNPLAYDHEYMGHATGIADAIIFAGKYEIKTFDPQPHWEGPYFGADWGFSLDPSTLVKLWIEVLEPDRDITVAKKNLYVEYAEFGQKVELDDYKFFYSGGKDGEGRTWDGVPDADKYNIQADSSRPETISHVSKQGFDIDAAEKWPGSVEDGITVLKSFVKIYIHTRCSEMQAEARLYSYKIDRVTKKVTPDIVDKFNHGWDAIRYALASFIKRKKKGFFDD